MERVTEEPFAVNPPGPVHERFEPFADSVKLLFVHIGLGVAITLEGAAGGAGSDTVTGPANTLDVHIVALLRLIDISL